jgi:hypothetical protein
MTKTLVILSGALLCAFTAISQSFTNSTAIVGQNFNSGGCVGVCDMDQDGLDDIIVLDQADDLFICYQEADGSYTVYDYGSISNSNQWGMSIGDIDKDGHNDVISGGNFDGIHFTAISARGVSSSSNLNNGSLFMQGCNVADIDNDGWLDHFACHDVGTSRIWQNDGGGGLSNTLTLIDLTDYDQGGYNTDHSGNYGSVWTDFDDDGDLDLFIAKCRQGVGDSNDPRRINQLWVNDGSNNYTEDADARGLVLNEQSWTSDFADVDNDGDFDCLITNHSTDLRLLENDGTGNFTDVTAAAGISGITGSFMQGKLEDMDNDGWVDLIFTGGVHSYYRNDGDGTFTEYSNTFPYSNTMHSLAIGDLNNDGALDLYASYGNIYVTPDNNNDDILWMNDGNSNNWVCFDLEGYTSNNNAIGAKVKITGDWGVQVREVRAGE